MPGRQLQVVELGLDELEALRLADLEGLYHDAAAEWMGVSRQTFGRLIERARHKVACALLNGRMLVFSGGPVMVTAQRTFQCADCNATFQSSHGKPRPAECPECHSRNIHRVPEERGFGRGGGGQRAAVEVGAGQGRCIRRRRGWSRLIDQTRPADATAEAAPAKEEGQ